MLEILSLLVDRLKLNFIGIKTNGIDGSDYEWFVYYTFVATNRSTVDSIDFIEITGMSVDKFLKQNTIQFQDNHSTFINHFTSFLQGQPALHYKFSLHFPYRIITP